jgi:hypothetical protein
MSHFGQLTSLAIIKLNNEEYIQFENKTNSTIQTLVVGVENENYKSEMEVKM